MLDLSKLEQQARESLEIAGRATEGPWYHWHLDAGVVVGSPDEHLGPNTICECSDLRTEPLRTQDAMFIVKARTAVPDLAQAVLDLAEENRELRLSTSELSFTAGRIVEHIREFTNAEKHCPYCDMDWDTYLTEEFPHMQHCPLADMERLLAGEHLKDVAIAEAGIDAETGGGA